MLVVCAVAGLASGRALVSARTPEPPVLAESIRDGLVTFEGVGPANPVVLDVESCSASLACTYLTAKAALGQADLRGLVVSGPGQAVEETRLHVAALREYGLEHLPNVTAGPDGADLIVAEARLATPERPLLVLTAAPAAAVVDAVRRDPAIADRLIVAVTGGSPGGIEQHVRTVDGDPPGPLPPVDGARARVERELPPGVLRDTLLASPAVTDGDVVGDAAFALFLSRPYTWRAVEPRDGVLTLTAFDMPEAAAEWFATFTDPVLHAARPEPEGLRAAIDFAPEDAPLADGYERDAGEAYGERDDGLEYGWDEDIEDDLRVRGLNDDVRYDTLAHFSKDGDRTWEIAVPDGTYEVRLGLGDPEHTDQVNTLDLEGTVVRDPDADHLDTPGATVEVTDGRLTIRPGPGAENAKICFVDIALVD